MSFGSGGPVNERVLGAGLCGRGTGTPACSDDDSPGDCKSVLVAIESFFRHGCAGGNHGTSRNGEGSIGVNAIAHSCYDSRTPGKKDEVSFVVTRIDEDRNVAVGLISRIIRQNI